VLRPLGRDTGTPVSNDYTCLTSHFMGKVKWVQIDIGKDSVNLDHLISAEDHLQLAMAQQ
jgi:arylsulfatase